MTSVRMRRTGARIVAPSMVLAALAGTLVAGPAAGQALASGSGSGGVQPPSPQGSASSNGLTYTSSIGGNYNLSGATPWTAPACWMQPFFPQTETWKAGDPSGGTTDADSYYSWFVSQGAPATSPAAQMTSEFKDIQNRTAPAGWTGPATIEANDVWWGPDMLNSSTGFACAQGLASANKLSNGYIGLEPPLQSGQQSPLVGAINVIVLTQVALAAITLPTISIITRPPGTPADSAVINTATYVAVKYTGDMDPSEIKTAGDFGLAPIWASVQATIASVTVSDPSDPTLAKTGFNDPGQTCAAVNGEAPPACSVTFNAPSGNTPDNLQVTVTWKVTWSTSAGTGGTFANTGSQQATKTVMVNEIQSQT
jgi:hypothetical protein